MNIQLIRQFCLIGLPISLLAATILHFTNKHITWSETFYILSLTANIGYFTNFIAIKMLFKPHHKTALGRQGLIPKNQDKLAKVLSETINDHFLSSEHWQEYLQQSQASEKLLNSLQNFCTNWFNDRKNQELLYKIIIDLLNNNQEEIEAFFNSTKKELIKELSNNFEAQDLLKKVFEWIDYQFENHPKEMEGLIEPIIKTLAENIPMIAEKLINTLDEHIDNQDMIRRNFAKAAKWSANLKEEDIQHYLFRMVASFEFRETLFNGLKSLINSYQLNNTKNHLDLNQFIDELINDLINKIRITPFLIQYLSSSTNQEKINQFITASIPNFFDWLKTKINSPQASAFIHKTIASIVEYFDLREIIKNKAQNFSPKKMEHIFQSMISDQLIFIELLGALLGALSGLALINITAFAILSGSLLAIYCLDYLLTTRKKQS